MKKVKVVFNAEIYEVYDEQGNLIDQAIDYDDLMELSEENNYDIISIGDEEEEEPKQKTNVDLVLQFMNFGSPMNQMFVIDALTKHAQNIVDNEEGVLKAMEGSFVDGPSWVRCAKDFLKQSEEFYK